MRRRDNCAKDGGPHPEPPAASTAAVRADSNGGPAGAATGSPSITGGAAAGEFGGAG